MASATQIQANRSNARKSTGPRTAAGKERASRNAVKHGLLAREAVIPGEDPEEFESYRQWMLADLAPAGAGEEMLAERVVGLSWRLRRAERLQNEAFAALDDETPMPLLNARLDEWKRLKGSKADRDVCGEIEEESTLGRVIVEDFTRARVLDRLLLYERRIESSLYRTMGELRRVRAEGRARAAQTPDGLGSSPGQAPPAKAGVATNLPAAVPEEVSRSECRVPAGQEAVTATRLASFGAETAPGDGTRKTTLERPQPAAGVARGTRTPSASLSGQAPTVVAIHGRDGDPKRDLSRLGTHARVTETPGGVTAGAPAVGPARHSSVPSLQPSKAVPAAPAEEQWCETNPVGEGVSSLKCQV